MEYQIIRFTHSIEDGDIEECLSSESLELAIEWLKQDVADYPHDEMILQIVSEKE